MQKTDAQVATTTGNMKQNIGSKILFAEICRKIKFSKHFENQVKNKF